MGSDLGLHTSDLGVKCDSGPSPRGTEVGTVSRLFNYSSGIKSAQAATVHAWEYCSHAQGWSRTGTCGSVPTEVSGTQLPGDLAGGMRAMRVKDTLTLTSSSAR